MITTRTRGIETKGATFDGMENRGRRRRGVSFGNDDAQKKFACDICNEEFANNHKLLCHKRRHNVSAVINYSENSNDGNGEDGEKWVVKEKETDFPCEKCGKILHTSKGLLLHGIKMHNQRALEIDKLKQESKAENEDVGVNSCAEVKSERSEIVLKSENEETISNKSELVNSKENRKEGNGVLKKGPNNFPCGTCGKLLNSRQGRILHEVKVHNRQRGVRKPTVKEKTFGGLECDKCGETFNSKKEISRHKVIVHQSEEQIVTELNVLEEFQCDKCLKTLPSKRGLLLHKIKMHGRRKGTAETLNRLSGEIYKCRYCVYATKLQMNLVKHERTHLPKEQRKKLDLANIRHCHLCPYSTADNSNFGKHLAVTHKLGKLRHCRMCSYQTFSSLTLKSHMKSKHRIDVAPSTTCSKCNTKFKSLYDLRCHLWKQLGQENSCADRKQSPKNNTIHSSKPPDLEIKNTTQPSTEAQILPPQPQILHPCQLCHKQFSSNAYLKKHINFAHSNFSGTNQQQPTIKPDNDELQSVENSKIDSLVDVVVKEEQIDPQEEPTQVKIELVEEKDPEGATSTMHNYKLRFKTDTLDLQCQFCFVVCWNHDALANHLKRHR